MKGFCLMERKAHSVKYNFIMNFALTATQFIFPLITFPYVSRILHATGTGKVSFASSVANYFMMMASLGIPTYGVRACARVRDDREQLSRTVHELFIINAMMTCLVMLTYVIAVFTVPRLAEEKTLFMVNGINICLNMFGMNWVYQALEQYDYITFRSIFLKIVSFGLMLLLIHRETDYIKYGAIVVFAAVGSYVLNFIRLRRIVDFKPLGEYDLKRHMKPVLILFSQSLAVSIYTHLDTVMLGFMKTDIDVGYYHAAVRVKTLLVSLVTSLGNVLLPRMSYYVKRDMWEVFLKYTVKGLNFALLMAIPMASYFSLFSKESILFLAGKGYEDAILPMAIITFTVIPIGITGLLGVQVLTSMEKEKYVLLSVIVGAVSDLILNLVFIPRYGAAGAAFATLIAECLVLVVQVYYTRDLLREIRPQIRILYYAALTVAATLLSMMVKRMHGLSNFLTLAISAAVFFSVYGLGLLAIKEPVVMGVITTARAKLRGKSKV